MTLRPRSSTNAAATPAVLLALLVGLVGLVGLGACGGDESDGADGGGDGPGFDSPFRDGASSSSGPSTEPSSPEPSSPTPSSPSPSPTVPSPDPGGPPVDLTRPPATYDAALQHFAAATATADLDAFETPSGNLFCAVAVEGLPPGCELGEGAVRDVGYCGADAPSIFVGRVELAGGVATAVCNTDTIRQDGAAFVDYGTVVTTAGTPVRCVVEQIGVTCLDTASAQGFFLARGSYVLITD